MVLQEHYEQWDKPHTGYNGGAIAVEVCGVTGHVKTHVKTKSELADAFGPGLTTLIPRYNEHSPTSLLCTKLTASECRNTHTHTYTNRHTHTNTHTEVGGYKDAHIVPRKLFSTAALSFSWHSLLNMILTTLPFKAMMQNYNLQKVAI